MSEVSRLQVIDFDFLFKNKLNRIYRVDIFQHLLGLFLNIGRHFLFFGIEREKRGGHPEINQYHDVCRPVGIKFIWSSFEEI